MVTAQRVATKSDNTTYCRPSSGYQDTVEIDLDGYEEVATVMGDLPECDEKWPKGAPLTDYVKYGDKILKKKVAVIP